MNRKNLEYEMKKFVGGGSFIKKIDLARFMGVKDPNTCNRYLSGLESVGRGLYYIPDVCAAILDE